MGKVAFRDASLSRDHPSVQARGSPGTRAVLPAASSPALPQQSSTTASPRDTRAHFSTNQRAVSLLRFPGAAQLGPRCAAGPGGTPALCPQPRPVCIQRPSPPQAEVAPGRSLLPCSQSPLRALSLAKSPTPFHSLSPGLQSSLQGSRVRAHAGAHRPTGCMVVGGRSSSTGPRRVLSTQLVQADARMRAAFTTWMRAMQSAGPEQ